MGSRKCVCGGEGEGGANNHALIQNLCYCCSPPRCSRTHAVGKVRRSHVFKPSSFKPPGTYASRTAFQLQATEHLHPTQPPQQESTICVCVRRVRRVLMLALTSLRCVVGMADFNKSSAGASPWPLR